MDWDNSSGCFHIFQTSKWGLVAFLAHTRVCATDCKDFCFQLKEYTKGHATIEPNTVDRRLIRGGNLIE